MTLRRVLLAAGFTLAALPALASAAFAQQGQPLHTGVDGTFAPHAMPKLGGGVEGFNIDLANAIAAKLHRPITIDNTTFSGLIPGLNAGRYDFIAAPTTVTKERAENLLFTDGYLWTDFQFGQKKGVAPITSLDDIKGKVIAVNKGSAYDAWATANAQKYGFTPQAYETQADCNQAVLSGRAYATLAGNTVIRYTATKTPLFVPTYELKDTRAEWSIPVRKDDVAMRNTLDEVVKCLKMDGTLVKLSEKWFGTTPAPDDLERVVEPGHGVPGMPGYDPTPYTPHCS
jgi:polar amino acid transport system substrate-binding protein